LQGTWERPPATTTTITNEDAQFPKLGTNPKMHTSALLSPYGKRTKYMESMFDIGNKPVLDLAQLNRLWMKTYLSPYKRDKIWTSPGLHPSPPMSSPCPHLCKRFANHPDWSWALQRYHTPPPGGWEAAEEQARLIVNSSGWAYRRA
jgi:hypothetical protein